MSGSFSAVSKKVLLRSINFEEKERESTPQKEVTIPEEYEKPPPEVSASAASLAKFDSGCPPCPPAQADHHSPRIWQNLTLAAHPDHRPRLPTLQICTTEPAAARGQGSARRRQDPLRRPELLKFSPFFFSRRNERIAALGMREPTDDVDL